MNFKLLTLSSITALSLCAVSIPLYAAQSGTPDQNQEQTMLLWLSTVDKHEIAAAKIALKNTKNQDIKTYAEEMINDHGKNLTETKHLMQQIGAKSHSDSSITELNEHGKKEATMLKHLKGHDFDKAYIDAMVNDHTEALETLDKDITSLDSSSKIAYHLKNTQASVSAHLNKAKAIQSNLSN